MSRAYPMTAHSQFPTKMPTSPGGVVVVGAGLAGLFTALKLAPLPVTVVSAARFGEGASSLWALRIAFVGQMRQILLHA